MKHSAAVRHRWFLKLAILFVTFRVLAIFLFRPGGFIADFSDYDFYRTWMLLGPAGYQAYDTLWTAYPPLFPALLSAVFEFSSRIPPWVDPRLAFHTFLGLALLIFDTGNLVLIYRLAEKLAADGQRDRETGRQEDRETGGQRDKEPGRLRNFLSSLSSFSSLNQPINQSTSQPATQFPHSSPTLYALFFAPVYTLLGWFEPMPLFFFLLGLDLLLERRREWAWWASAVAAALGFLTKLTPALLVPIAVRRLGAKFSLAAARREWFDDASPGSIQNALTYAQLFILTVLVVGYPFVRANPALALSSFRVQSIRPPWESLWAVLDGYFGYGLVPLDMRNLAGLDGPLWQSRLPWGWITLGFLLVYLFLYTRSYDWERPRTPVAFAGVSVIWLFLYSKGWSPQFVVWVLAFIALLLPTLRGVIIAAVLMLANFVEADLFLIILPGETWLLWGTVLLRTTLLILLAVEFLGQIWPAPAPADALRRWSANLSWATIAVAVIGLGAGAPRLGQAYAQTRLAAHPCREAVELLRAQAEWPDRVIATHQTETWEQFYPWLRENYDLRVVDGYRPGADPASVVAERLAALGEEEQIFWWLEMNDAAQGEDDPRRRGVESYLGRADVQLLEPQTLGACRLGRVVQRPSAPLATAQVEGGPIQLVTVQLDEPVPGEALHLVLYWQAQSSVRESYTVFTQLFDEAGNLIAQQDNLPVEGLAPTDTWQPGVLVRDPYRLFVPEDVQRGALRLLVGLYTPEGRVSLQASNVPPRDYLELKLSVP